MHTWVAKLVGLGAFVAVAATGATALGGGSAPAASELSCGDTITADTTLTSDLVDCPSNGIVIGADDITLDLNGHTVAGNGRAVSCPGTRSATSGWSTTATTESPCETARCAASRPACSSGGHATTGC